MDLPFVEVKTHAIKGVDTRIALVNRLDDFSYRWDRGYFYYITG
jgi:hypothetical protein